jgi:hypothetical protein
MKHVTVQRVLFEGLAGKPVSVEFTAPRQSSDGGVALLRQVDARLGLTESLAECLREHRTSGRVQHDLGLLVRQRVLSIALGYPDGNDAARIGDDPMLKLACGRSPDSTRSLASQPTISRFECDRTGRELVAMARTLETLVIKKLARRSKRARRVTIDLDSTVDPTHGSQQHSLFNRYHDTWCYLPLLGFLTIDDEPEQHLFFARLRPGTARDMRGVLPLLSRVVPELKRRFPRAEVLVRLDAGFCGPQLLALLDKLGARYVVGLAQNSRLSEFAERHMTAARSLTEKFGSATQFFGECEYAAKSWSCERRVIFKAEVVTLERRNPRDNLRFVVTNLSGSPESLWQLYARRGDSENRIKELKCDLQMDRTSSTCFLANQLRVLLAATAFVLLQALRGALRDTELARAQVGTLRLKLLKVAANVRTTWRRIVISMPDTYAWVSTWRVAALAVGAAPY